MRLGCLPVIVAVALTLILPWVFADMLATALIKLHLPSTTATLLVLGIFAGSLVNIPIRRLGRDQLMPVDPLAVFGLHGLWPKIRRTRAETTVAVNVGGCVIPAGLAAYEMATLLGNGHVIVVVAVAVLVNVLVCYKLARPVAGVGIVMPPIVPALVACAIAIAAVPSYATPVAFIAGVAGPLVGADLLHLRDVAGIDSGVVSIGGAGTFDGILLSGILALYLA